MAHFCVRGLLRDGLIVGHAALQQRHLVVFHAELRQGAAALARVADADDPFQGVVRAAGGGQQGVPRPQHAEEGHRQGVGSGEEVGPAEGVLGPHHLGEEGVQLVPPGVVVAVAGGAHQMGGGHLLVGEGLEHLHLVVVADGVHLLKIRPAELHGLLVQLQKAGGKVEKFFQHFSMYSPFQSFSGAA